MLRQVRPRRRIDGGRHRDHVERARRDRRQQERRGVGGPGDLRPVVIEAARRREVEAVLDRRRLVGVEPAARGRGGDRAADRDGAGRDLVQHRQRLAAAGGVGDDDLAGVDHAGHQLAGDVLLDLLGALPGVAIVGAEVALADQDLLVGRPGDGRDLDHRGDRVAAGGDRGARAGRDHRVGLRGERQLEERQRGHRRRQAGGGVDHVRRQERAVAVGREVAPQPHRADQVGPDGVDPPLPPVVLGPLLRAVGGAVHRRLLLAHHHHVALEVVGLVGDLGAAAPRRRLLGLGRGRRRRRAGHRDPARQLLGRRLVGRRHRHRLAEAVATQRAAGDDRVDQPIVGAGVGRDQLDGVGQPAVQHRADLGVAAGQERQLQRVEPRQPVRRQVRRQIGVDQPVIDERRVQLGREVRLERAIEPRAILAVDEQRQLVARVARVQRAPLGLGQGRPARQEVPAGQGRVARQRAQRAVQLVDGVDQLDPRRRAIDDRDRRRRRHRGQAPILADVAVERQRRGQAPVAHGQRRRRAHQPVRGGRRRVDDQDVQLRGVTERGGRDHHLAGGVGRQVGQHPRRRRQEVVGGERRIVAAAAAAAAALARHRTAVARRGHRWRRGRRGERRARARVLGRGRRRAQRPRVEQQRRLVEQHAGAARQPLAIEHVAVLVADVAAREVARAPEPTALAAGLAHGGGQPRILDRRRRQRRRDHVDPGRRRAAAHADPQPAVGGERHRRGGRRPRRQLDQPVGQRRPAAHRHDRRRHHDHAVGGVADLRLVLARPQPREPQRARLGLDVSGDVAQRGAAAPLDHLPRQRPRRRAGAIGRRRQHHRLALAHHLRARDHRGQLVEREALGLVAAGRGEAGDTRQRAQPQLAALVGGQRHLDRPGHGARRQRQRHRAPGPRLARLAVDAEAQPVGRGAQVHRRGGVPVVHRADRERAIGAQVDRALLRHHAHPAADRQPDLARVDRHRDLDLGVGVVGQRQRLAVGRGHRLAVDRRDLEERVLEQRPRHRHAAQPQRHPRHRGRDLAGHQALAIEQPGHAELVALAAQLDGRGHRDVAVDHERRRRPGPRRERQRDRAVGAGAELAPAEPQAGPGARLAALVDDVDRQPGRGGPAGQAQVALADQRAAGAAAADQLDDVGAGARARRQRQPQHLPHHRRRRQLAHLLPARGHAVEIDRQVDVGAAGGEPRRGVDAKHPHPQRRHVLDRHREADLGVARPTRRVDRQ